MIRLNASMLTAQSSVRKKRSIL